MDEKGFTLIELTSTMVIAGIITAVAVKKVDCAIQLGNTVTKNKVLSEMNVRSMNTWANVMLSNTGYVSDSHTFQMLNKDLERVTWKNLTEKGGFFEVDGKVYEITRNPSSLEKSATWE